MMFRLLLPLVALLSVVLETSAFGFLTGEIKNIVFFGDSYTSMNPNGTRQYPWPVSVQQYGGFNIYDLAQSGATCSNNLFPVPYPSVMEAQLPQYFDEVANGTLDLDLEETLFVLWIGTNDLGTLVRKNQVYGATVVSFVECVLAWVRQIYALGARKMMVMNPFPLEKTILYSKDSYLNTYWTIPVNFTEVHLEMVDLVAATRALEFSYLSLLALELNNATIGYFDTYSFFIDVFENYEDYYNGTVPLNMTGCINSCVFQPYASTGDCDYVPMGPEWDSYRMYDELHPSTQSDRNLGRIFTDVVLGITEDFMYWLPDMPTSMMKHFY